MMRRIFYMVAALAWIAGAAQAEIAYDARKRTITVTGFSSATLGTLQDVYRKSTEQNWGVVAYNEATQTCAIRAHLVLGANDGSSTWFRIGTLERPRETLILQGDLRLTEPKAGSGYRQFVGRNVLWIGDENRPDIRPTVKFDCAKTDQYGFLAGDGNVLRLCRATISVVTPDRQHTARSEIRAGDVRIIDSTMEWMGRQAMLYGFSSLDRFGAVVRGSIFQHGRAAIANGQHWVEDCVFRDLDVAVLDQGSVDATLVRCRFEDNKRNWDLAVTQFGIVAIDCTFGPEKDPGPRLRRGKIIGQEKGPWRYPRFIAKRHLAVKVTDEAGKPVPGALVTLTESGGKAEAVDHGVARTDATGKTPAPFEYGAILVTDYGHRATDEAPTPDSPDCRVQSYDYRFDIRVSADGYRDAVIKGVDSDQSWVEKTVALRRK